MADQDGAVPAAPGGEGSSPSIQDLLKTMSDRLEAIETQARADSMRGDTGSAHSIEGFRGQKLGKPEPFSGDEDVVSWLFRFNMFLDAAGVAETERTTYLGLMLKQEASRWYHAYVSRIHSAGGLVPSYSVVSTAL